MTRFLLVRSGATDFEEQGRLKGTLDIPLSTCGLQQVGKLVSELADQPFDAVYFGPCECCKQTAEALAAARKVRSKLVPELRNVDHGLWAGKLVEEVRQSQPKVYRQWQDHPETVCPPQGESVADALSRVSAVIDRLSWKHRGKAIAVVAVEPLFSLVRAAIDDSPVGDLWKAACAPAGWQWVEQREASTQVRGA